MKNKIIPAVKTVAFMSITTATMILLMSLLFYKAEIDDKGIKLGVVITYFITTFIGGFIFGKVNEKKKYLFGILIGVIYFLLLMVCSLIWGNIETLFTGRILAALISCIAGGMIGGMVSN